jgi:hypothetical protein
MKFFVQWNFIDVIHFVDYIFELKDGNDIRIRVLD